MYKVYFDKVRAANPHESVHPCMSFLSFVSQLSLTSSFVFKDFDRLIKPLLEREALQLDDAGEMELDDEIEEIKADREEAKAEAVKNKKAKM